MRGSYHNLKWFGLTVVLLTVLVLGYLLPAPRAVPADALQAPTTEHWLGTHPVGHDLMRLLVVAACRDLGLSLWITAQLLLLRWA
jgi:hypothetical protein